MLGLSIWFCLSVCSLFSEKFHNLAIYSVKQLLNPTVTLTKKEHVPDRDQSDSILRIFSTFIGIIRPFQYGQQLGYNRGRVCAGSGHVFILEYAYGEVSMSVMLSVQGGYSTNTSSIYQSLMQLSFPHFNVGMNRSAPGMS